jgi:hypothetical protein
MPYLANVGVDLRVLGYALLVALTTGVIFGLVPAIPASRSALAPTLKVGGRTTAGRRRTWRNALVVGELALTLVLLIGAGLLTQSVVRLLRVDPGFRPERVLTTGVLLPRTKYTDSTSIRVFFQELVARIEALPGVTGVGLTSRLPLDWGNSSGYVVAGRPLPAPGQRPAASERAVSSGYFRTLGIPLIEGRDFTDQDGPNAPLVIIINRGRRPALRRSSCGWRADRLRPVGPRSLLQRRWCRRQRADRPARRDANADHVPSARPGCGQRDVRGHTDQG